MAGTLYGADVVQLRSLASQPGCSVSAPNGLRRRPAADLAAQNPIARAAYGGRK